MYILFKLKSLYLCKTYYMHKDKNEEKESINLLYISSSFLFLPVYFSQVHNASAFVNRTVPCLNRLKDPCSCERLCQWGGAPHIGLNLWFCDVMYVRARTRSNDDIHYTCEWDEDSPWKEEEYRKRVFSQCYCCCTA